MGLCAARALLKLGATVTVLDQGPLPNPLGASVDHTRALRSAYGGNTGYMRMALDARAAWRRVWSDIGADLLVETGLLVLSDGSGTWSPASRHALAAAGVPVEDIAPADLAARYPMLQAAAVADAFHVGDGGVLLAARIVEGLLGWLEANGANVHARTPVVAIDPDHAAVEVDSQGHGRWQIDADSLIVAAGPWTAKLLPALGGVARPSRQVTVYAEPPLELARAWASAPLIVMDSGSVGLYVVPPVAGYGLKFGDHRFSLAGDPDDDRTPRDGDARAVVAPAASLLRDFKRYRLGEARPCFYDVEPEERFVVAPLDGAQRSWVMTGFSGHGFKFGPLLGDMLAEAVAGRLDGAALTAWAQGFDGDA